LISSRVFASLFVLLLWLAPPGPALAAATLTVDPAAAQIPIAGAHLDLLLDPRQVHDIESLQSGAADADFVAGTAAVPIFQNLAGTAWARLRLKNPTAKTLERSLVVEFANFHRMTVFVPSADGYRPRTLDIARHVRDTDYGYRYPSYGITLQPGATETIYIAINSYSARFPLKLWQVDALERFALREFWLQGLLFGIVLCVLAYQIALTFLARQSEHWSLALCIVLTSLTLLCMLGYQHVYLGRLGDWLTRAYPALLCAMAGSIALFTRHFLLLGERLRPVDIALRIVQWLYFGIGALSLVAPAMVTSLFAGFMLLGCALVTAALIGLARKRDINAALYAVSFAPVVATGVYGSLVNARLVEMPGHYHTLISGGFALGLLMFAFSSAYRIGQTRKEQHALQTAKRGAEDRARMQAEFLANMSHEVRTPLNAVIGNLDLIERHTADSTQHRRIATALTQSRILLGLFDQALEFSRIEAAPVEPAQEAFQLRTIVAEVVEMVSSRAGEKGLALRQEVDTSVPATLIGDGPKLQQVLLNLLANAIKFTEHGTVSLRVSVRAADDEQAERLRVAVEDTGIGIPPAAQGRIFERFVQADDSIRHRFGGTGLGLSISRTLIEALGGRIGVISTEGRGSSFWFEIPLRACAVPERAPGTPTHIEPSPPLRILVAEDSPINRELVSAMLAEDGHTVICAENGRQALERLGAESVDVVLMDVSMPEMDGVEATRRIRAMEGSACRSIPILGLTAHAVPEMVLSFIEAGMDDVLTKPVRLKDLQTALNGIRLRDPKKPGLADEAGVNREIFDAHLARLGAERLSRLLKNQFDETRAQVEALKQSDLAPDLVSERFHRLAGAFLFVGLPSLGDLCRNIEHNPAVNEGTCLRLAAELAAIESQTADIIATAQFPGGPLQTAAAGAG